MPRPGVARSAPGSASSGSNPIAPEVAGATQPEVIASANGEAQIEIDLGDRHLVRIGPR